MKRIKWGNVIEMGVLLICLSIILHDIVLILYGIVSGLSISWTTYGFITFLLLTSLASTIMDDFDEQLKNVANKSKINHI